jgi:Fe-S cluster assembly protein SufD
MQPRIKYGLTIQLNTKNLQLVEQPQGSSTNQVSGKNASIKPLSTHVLKHKTSVFEPDEFSNYQERNAKDGLLIHVQAGDNATINLDRRIQGDCVHHILVLVEANATLTLIDEYTGSPKTHVGAVEIIAYENAKVKYATIQQLDSGFDFVNYRARAHQNAQIDWFIAQFGGDLSRAVVDTELAGEGSAVRSYGVYMGDDSQQFDRSDACMHKANKTSSDMNTKGVLRGSSKAIFRGTIDIDSEAFGCDGYQKNHTLLLSGNAVADAIPNLEIRNNDVKCSHGATIGRIDEEHLFYLTSRGIDEEQATKMLVEGFFADLSNALDWDELTEKVLQKAHEQLQ